MANLHIHSMIFFWGCSFNDLCHSWNMVGSCGLFSVPTNRPNWWQAVIAWGVIARDSIPMACDNIKLLETHYRLSLPQGVSAKDSTPMACDNMKTPERWRTSRDPCCKVPSPQSPIAMMDRHTQTNGYVKRFSQETAELQTDTHTHTHTHTGPILLPRLRRWRGR